MCFEELRSLFWWSLMKFDWFFDEFRCIVFIAFKDMWYLVDKIWLFPHLPSKSEVCNVSKASKGTQGGQAKQCSTTRKTSWPIDMIINQHRWYFLNAGACLLSCAILLLVQLVVHRRRFRSWSETMVAKQVSPAVTHRLVRKSPGSGPGSGQSRPKIAQRAGTHSLYKPPSALMEVDDGERAQDGATP